MSQRLTRKQLKQDKFVDLTRTALAYARENVFVSTLGVIALIAVVALAVRIGGTAIGGGVPKDSEAQRALASARIELLRGELETGAAALEDLRSRHSGSKAAREATYLLGNALFEIGDYERARQAFEDFLRDPLYEDLLRDGARLAIAACKEESGNLAAATEDYTAIWNSTATPATRLQAALAGARCARSQGQESQAIDLYRAIVDAFPTAPETDQARFALLELTGSSS